ncbi:MAG: type III-A CRISPR-associated RAMP protein Csm3 [Clostridiales bacterium]|nr:type III-A CRISPR-associated RAMP protein Csm3 [Clostridiales bacterium]
MYTKILIQFDLEVVTGMHIGGSSAFSAIGAVDSPVIRDALTGRPIVPGSSLKGKLRTLLARSFAGDIQKMPEFKDDHPAVLRMFGSTSARSRLQFTDAFVRNAETMKAVGLTEVKSENVIKRLTSEAMPRQIERVNPGTIFAETIVYDVCDQEEMLEDLTLLAKAMKLLQMDYLGGHGSRGSGRVSLKNFRIQDFDGKTDCAQLQKLFDEVAGYELFSVPAGI